MKSFFKLLCLTSCLSFLVLTIEAQTNFCDEKDINIYFGNGMNNTIIDANNSRIALENKLKNQLPKDLNIQYGYSFNHPEDQASQLMEVLRQYSVDDYSQVFRWLSGVVIAPQWFQDWMLATARGYDAFEYVVDSDLQRHVQAYRSNILEGKPVILVSHSQGNFYANRAAGILNSQSFTIVAVATPSGFVAGGGNYTTLTNDRIMQVVPANLPGNTTNSNSYEWTNHNFDKSYLNDDVSGLKIINHIKSAIANVKYPQQEGNQGLITVTLEWGAEPDVDLHVFEPNGTHVYYENPQGKSGYLDVDDITSFGPEHYYVSCDLIEIGTYAIGVNYYRGRTPEVARIQVKAGNQIRNFTANLPNELGQHGDSSPLIVAQINYFLNDRTGRHEFEITSPADNGRLMTSKNIKSDILSSKKYKSDKIFSK